MHTVDSLQQQIRRAPSAPLAERIRYARCYAYIDGETVKLSHDELVARLGKGSRQHLIKLEKGQHRPNADTLRMIAEATGRQVEWFLEPDGDPFHEAAA